MSKEPRYTILPRALEGIMLERGFDRTRLKRAANLHPNLLERLLSTDPSHRRDYREYTVRLLIRTLRIDPQRLVEESLSEQEVKNLRYVPPPTRKNHDLGELYSRQPTGGKPTQRPAAARRRDVRRHGSGDEEVA
jgi:hypothetical protein